MGFAEIIFILFMVLVLFGADKLPEIARTLGKTIRQVRDATDEIRSEIQRGVEKTGIDTSFIEETQKEIEKMKEEIEQTNLLKK